MAGITLAAVPYGQPTTGAHWLYIAEAFPLLMAEPIRRWVFEQPNVVHVLGADEEIPDGCPTLDVPLTDQEYEEFLRARKGRG